MTGEVNSQKPLGSYELSKYSDDASITDEQVKTSKNVMRKQGSRVYGSAAGVLAVSSNGGNIRGAAADSIRRIQTARADSSRPIQVAAIGKDLETRPKVRVENVGKAPTPMEVLRKKASQATEERVYTFPDETRLGKCLSKHPGLDFEYYREKGITHAVSGLAAERFAKGERVEWGITIGARLVVLDLKEGVDGFTGKELPKVIPNTGLVKNVISLDLEIALKNCSNKKGMIERAVDWIKEHTPPGGHYEVVP